MQGKKTHEQQIRTFERKDDVPKPGEVGPRGSGPVPTVDTPLPTVERPQARHSEMPVSRGGMNQESDHNKHNDPGQSGHRPQKRHPAEEKQ